MTSRYLSLVQHDTHLSPKEERKNKLDGTHVNS